MADPKNVARVKLLKTLMRHVEQDAFPSSTMMDTIEEILEPEEIPAYADILIKHIEADPFPSTSMIYRVRTLGT